MKKFKFASAVVALALGVLMLIGSIPVFLGKGGALYEIFLYYGVGIAALMMLGIGITQAIKKDLPVSAGFHIALGVVGILFQLISYFIGGYFMIMVSTTYGILLLVMELREMKQQKGFAEKGLALMIAISAVFYAGSYLLLIMLAKLLPGAAENIVYGLCLTALPALLVAKGVVDIVRSFKPAKPEAVAEKPAEEKAEEPAEEKAE